MVMREILNVNIRIYLYNLQGASSEAAWWASFEDISSEAFRHGQAGRGRSQCVSVSAFQPHEMIVDFRRH